MIKLYNTDTVDSKVGVLNTSITEGLNTKANSSHTHDIYVKKAGDTMTGNLIVNGSVKVGNKVTLQYDSTNECLNFVFA